MKILVVCQYYYPEIFQVTPVCEQLVCDGNDVTVLTGLPNYPTGIIPDKYKKGYREEEINGVHVVRAGEIGRKKGLFWLALNYLSFWYSANRKINVFDSAFDLVFVYQLSPVMMGLPGVKYAKKHKKPLILYCSDLWPESMKSYIGEGNPLFKVFQRISKRVYSSCDKIICQSRSFIDYLINTHKIVESRLEYIPTFADEAYLKHDFTPQDSIVDFVFLGNLGKAQNLIAVLEAVDKIKHIPDFKVHFVGDGSCLGEMKQFVDSKGLSKVVKFYGHRPVDEMPEFYKLADICLVSLKADSQVGFSLPGKIQGYMAAGKPIIGMIDGSAKDVIEDAKCGICVEADDIDGFAKIMRYAIENKSLHSEWGQNARLYFVNNFRKKTFMDRLEKEFIEMLGSKQQATI